jgi:hypothetical protein
MCPNNRLQREVTSEAEQELKVTLARSRLYVQVENHPPEVSKLYGVCRALSCPSDAICSLRVACPFRNNSVTIPASCNLGAAPS